MYNKFFTLFLCAFIAIVFTAISFGQVFTDDFESYTVGGQLVCQDSVNWTTWSNLPCDPIEDAYISDNYAYSGTNSVVIVHNNDVFKPLGTQTSGKWDIGFMVYIPAGKGSYFNCAAVFFGTTFTGAMHVFFTPNGAGEIYAGSPTLIPFTYLHDTWQSIEIIVDLDNDIGEFFVEGVLIHSWTWTLGPIGGGIPLQLDAVNFNGWGPGDEIYYDDFMFDQIVSVENEEIPIEYALHQNYPNPFNPSTSIQFSISQTSFVTLEVFNALGEKASVLVSEELGVGTYNYDWNAENLPSGIYFYQLQTPNFTQTKKMILLK